MRITSTARSQWVQDIVGIGVIALILGFFVYEIGRSFLVAAIWVATMCVLGTTAAYLRRWVFSPMRISVDTHGIEILSSGDPIIAVGWDDIKKASHSIDLGGGKWTLELKEEREVVIRDDGIGPDCWRDLSRLICHEVADKRGAPVWLDPIHVALWRGPP